VRELEALGAHVTVFSQKRPIEPKVHALALELRASVIYLSPWWREAPRILWAHVLMAVRNPAAYWNSVKFVATRPNLPTMKKFWRSGLVAHECVQRGIQLLHGHFISGNTRLARFASDLAGIPYSVTAHAKDIFAAGLSDSKLARRLHGAAFVATISEHNRQYLLSKAPKARVKMIPNSVRPDEFAFAR